MNQTMQTLIQYFRNIKETIATTAVGFGVTFKHLFTKSVTLQYPDQRWDLPERSRMKLFMDWDDCIGCMKCARACPVECIHISTTKVPRDFEGLGETSGGVQKRLLVEQFDIDLSECLYCALCVYPCPTECIYMTTEYEVATYNKEELIQDFAPVPEELRRQVYAAIEEEKQAKEAARKKKEQAKAESDESENDSEQEG